MCIRDRISGVLGYDPNKAPIERDMDKARAELAKCKYNPADYTLDLAWIAEVPYEEPWSLQLQANAIELGFNATVTGLPWAKFSEQVANWENTPHATVVSVLANVPDPDALKTSQKLCLLYTSPSPRDLSTSRMPSSA